MCAKFLCKKCTFNSTFILSINQSSILHQLQPHFICNFIANEKLLNNYLTLIRNKCMNKNMVAGMIKVVCGTITGVVSLINIVTMLYALMHSNSLQDGKNT